MSLDSLTISMLGLEKHLWDDVPKSEKLLYSSVLLCFMIFTLLALISGTTLFFFITSSIYIAIPLGFVLSLVVGTIVRFSLVILRKSIFDVAKVKKDKKEVEKNTEKIVELENADSNVNQVSNQINMSSKIQDIREKSMNLFSQLSKFIKSDTPIPILTGMIRFFIISVIGLLVLFPLACIFNFQKIEALNQSKRESCVNQFIKDNNEFLKMKTAYINAEIVKTENDIYQQKGLLKDKSAQLGLLNQKLKGIVNQHSQEFENNLTAYKEDIKSRYFIVQSFKAVIHFPNFLLTAMLITFLLLTSHLALHKLKTDKKFVYAEISTKYYKQIIEEKYNDNQKYLLKILKDKFQYTPQEGYETMVWENPPYCTKKKAHFTLRNKLNKDEFLMSLSKQSI